MAMIRVHLEHHILIIDYRDHGKQKKTPFHEISMIKTTRSSNNVERDTTICYQTSTITCIYMRFGTMKPKQNPTQKALLLNSRPRSSGVYYKLWHFEECMQQHQGIGRCIGRFSLHKHK